MVVLGAGLVGMPLPLVGVGLVFLAAIGSRWDVDTDGRSLFIRGAFRSAEVPLTQVSEVRLLWRMQGPRIAVTCTVETPFGRRVVFEPTLDWMATAYEHRVARELRGLVARAKERGDPRTPKS